MSERNKEACLAIYELETFGIQNLLESGSWSLKEKKMFWETFPACQKLGKERNISPPQF